MTDYRTLKTNQGLALEAAAETGGNAITLTTLVVGDGGGNDVIPDARQTALIREVTRVKLNTVMQKEGDAAQWVAEAVIPADNGGYTVREVGLLTDDGVLFAVGNFPDTYKPRPDEGTAGQLTITMNFKAQNADNITLMIDGNVAVATRAWVGDQLNEVAQKVGETQAALVSGLGYGGDNLNITRLWRGSKGVVCVRDQDNNVTFLQPTGDYAMRDDLSHVVTSVGDDADFQINQIGINKKTGQIWGHNDASNTFFYFQPAGDYATNSAVSAETQRAKAAEATLVSGLGYGSDNLNITRLWRGSKGTVCVRDQNGTVSFLQEIGDYATNSTVSAETQRAQAVEAGLVPLDGTKWMSGQLVVASGPLSDNTQAGGFSARFKDGSISARFTVGLDAQNYPYASVSFFDQNGGYHQWQFGANNRITTPNGGVVLETLPSEDGRLWAHNYGGDDRQLAWLDDVAAERARAQAAESSLSAALTSESQRAQAAEAQLVSGQGYGGDNLNITRFWRGSSGTICVRDQTDSVSFLANDGIIDAGGKCIRTLTLSATTGQWISWPAPFSSDDVKLIITPIDSGNNRFHVANYFSASRNGFYLSLNYWTGSTFTNETNAVQIQVIAIGYR